MERFYKFHKLLFIDEPKHEFSETKKKYDLNATSI